MSSELRYCMIEFHTIMSNIHLRRVTADPWHTLKMSTDLEIFRRHFCVLQNFDGCHTGTVSVKTSATNVRDRFKQKKRRISEKKYEKNP